MDSIDQICELQGLDVLFIGLYDLNQSLGFKGDVENLEFVKYFHDLLKKLNKKNIAVGTYAPNAEKAIEMIEMGVSFITVNVDGAMLRSSYEKLINTIR